MQPPMSASLMREGKAITPFLGRVLHRVEGLVDDDAPLTEEYRTEDVGLLATAGPRNAKRLMQIVKFDPQLQMLFYNILYWYR